MKLIKRFKKRSPNHLVQQKRQIFVHVLRRMRAHNQPDDIDTPEDYIRVWTDQIDRGGLYQIKPEVIIVLYMLAYFSLKDLLILCPKNIYDSTVFLCRFMP